MSEIPLETLATSGLSHDFQARRKRHCSLLLDGSQTPFWDSLLDVEIVAKLLDLWVDLIRIWFWLLPCLLPDASDTSVRCGAGPRALG